MATWVTADGIVVQPTTADIAARLHVSPETYLRDELNSVLTELKTRGFVRYEMDEQRIIHWRLTHDGWGMARRISTGVTGFERSGAADRSRDRFAQVREGTVPERLDPTRPGGRLDRNLGLPRHEWRR